MEIEIPAYGTASDLAPQDRSWLVKLDGELWDPRSELPDRSEYLQRQLSREELQTVVNLIRTHRLPVMMTSGPYGNLSLHIANHSPRPESPPERLLSLSERHMGVQSTFQTWDRTFDALSRITHTDENRQVVEFYGLPLPGPRDSYRY